MSRILPVIFKGYIEIYYKITTFKVDKNCEQLVACSYMNYSRHPSQSKLKATSQCIILHSLGKDR